MTHQERTAVQEARATGANDADIRTLLELMRAKVQADAAPQPMADAPPTPEQE